MVKKDMAYSTVAYPGRDHGGANGFRLPDGYINSGNGELRKKLGSMDDTLNVDSPNQVRIFLMRLVVKAEAYVTFNGSHSCVQSIFTVNVRVNANDVWSASITNAM